MNLGTLDLHGRVRAFSGGKLLWDRPNKITTLGRKALLAAMANSTEIEQSYDYNWFYKNDTNPWIFNPKSWISCYAFGNGGSLGNQNTVIPAATSMSDLNLFHIVPLRANNPTSDHYDLSEYVALPPKSTLNPDSYNNGGDYALSRHTSNYSDPAISKVDPDKYVYFKRIVSKDLGVKSIHTIEEGELDQSSSRIGIHQFETALLKFSLTISSSDLQRVFPEDATAEDRERIVRDCKINELSLFIANISKDGSLIKTNPWIFPAYEEDDDSGIRTLPTIPIQFSHITFPTENFFGNPSKDLDLEYYVFA